MSDNDIARAIACMEISGYKKINSRSVREYLKSYLRGYAEDSMHILGKEFQHPQYKFYDVFMESREKLKGIK